MTVLDHEQAAMWAAFRRSALSNLSAVFDNLDLDVVAEVAHDLRSRDHVYVAGERAAHYLAQYVRFVASTVSPAFRLVDLDGNTFVEDVVDMTDRDALVCLSAASSPGALVRVARLARERDALVIAIVDGSPSRLAGLSDRLLTVPRQGPSFFESHVAVLAVVETLIGLVALGAGHAGRNRINRIAADRLMLERPQERVADDN
ncbi:MAG: SIS domain-containing protein [Rhodospirillales bacterium]|nr:SIS domain-containing protein [Rhodospirillales bacterium]